MRVAYGALAPLLLSLLATLALGSSLINITTVKIPRLVKIGSPEPVILDCDYDLGNSSSRGLVVKWFVNDDILYQWILGMKPAGAVELREYIDASFKASDDPLTMYRAVKLVKLGPELSGNIKCCISTFADENLAVRKMLVYSPERSLQLRPVLNKTTNELTVTCLAEDIYPRPQILILQDRKPIEKQEQSHKTSTDGRWNAKSIATLKADKIELPTLFQCNVAIPEANYTSVQEYLYNGSHVPCLSLLLITLNLVTIKMY